MCWLRPARRPSARPGHCVGGHRGKQHAARSADGGSALVEGFVEMPLQTLRGRERPVGIWGWPAPRPN